jgi:2-polyprenyl-3-methyl-5-hydroxy-6-metoxy-1,4-benzoquinol methylase
MSQCIVCSSPVHEILAGLFDTRFGVNELYQIARCTSCQLEQTFPRPSNDQLQRLYETYYNFGGEKETAYTRARLRFLTSFAYDFWLKIDGDISFYLLKGPGRLLDVGCNEGRGLMRYRHQGFDAEGLEFNTTAAAAARASGFMVHTSRLEELIMPAPYDIVTLSNVLEHALDPKAMLREIRRLMKPDGQLWISCPNSRSFWRILFGRYWINWHVPFHLIHFSPRSLETLLKDSGFMILHQSQATPALWITQSILAALFATRGKPTKQMRSRFLVAPLILIIRFLLFPVLWAFNVLGRGDCLLFQVTPSGRSV